MTTPQQEIYEYIKSILPSEEVQFNTEDVTVFVPGKSFAFQYNDLMENSSKVNSNRQLNRNKALKFRAANIKFLAVFSDEWANKKDLVKAMIRHRLGVASGVRVGARRLTVKRIEKNKEFKGFFEKFHLDGHTNAKFALVLLHGDIIVAALTIRTNHAGECEIGRFATDYNYVIPGAAGKLVEELKNHVKGKLISYSNNRLSEGGVYTKLGFTKIAENAPSYWYTDGSSRTWRFFCKRCNDKEILAKYPEVPHTETDQALGGIFSLKIFGDRRPLYKIYDCGHQKWGIDI